eukprot:XP_001707837.1 Hypothetical protein GL50803_30645 [Giardia lamblia ATCC 50803]
MAPSFLTRTSRSSTSSGASPWRMLGRTPTALSSSSPWPTLLGSTASTLSSGVSLTGWTSSRQSRLRRPGPTTSRLRRLSSPTVACSSKPK